MRNLKPKLVLLDIDGTLFDYEGYKDFIIQKLSEILEIDTFESERIYRKSIDETRSRHGSFLPERFLETVVKNSESSLDKTHFYDKIFNEQIIESYLFPDVSHFLEQISASAGLGVLSKGFPNYQGLKVKAFRKLLRDDKVYIFPNKKDEASRVTSENKDFKVYFIDNDPETLEVYKNADPSWTTILIERYGELSYNYVSDFRTKSLLEAIEIIEK